MEKVKDNKDIYNYDYLVNKINDTIQEFMLLQNIDNLIDAQQNIFTACLMYTGKKIFVNDFFVISENANKKIYNYVLIDKLIDYYIYICKLYNKISSVYDFCLFINIRYKMFLSWNVKNNNNYDIFELDMIKELYKVYDNNNIDNYIILLHNIINSDGDIITTLKSDIFDKLHVDREKALSNKLVSNQNAIGAVTVVNKEYKWNLQELQQTQQIKALTLQELPKIENI